MNKRELFIQQAQKCNSKLDIKSFLKMVDKSFITEKIIEYRRNLCIVINEDNHNVLYGYSCDNKRFVKICEIKGV